MKNYELYLILKPMREENAIQKTYRELEALLNKYGAQVLKKEAGESKRLAYPINNKLDSFQTIFEISIEPDKIKELNRQLLLFDAVVRHTLFKIEEAAAV